MLKEKFVEFFPFVAYLSLGAFAFMLIGATLALLFFKPQTAKEQASKSTAWTLTLVLGALAAGALGYYLMAAYDYPKMAFKVAAALVYAIAFAAGGSLSVTAGVRKTMMKSLYGLVATMFAAILFLMQFGGHEAENREFKVDLSDEKRLQHGAAVFRDYCLSCHGLALVRTNQMLKLGLSKEQLEATMLTSVDKIGEPMHVAMRSEDAKVWFGAAPPDLSLEASAKKPEWIYSYLTGFYKDDERPTGWNNIAFDKVAMPHVLWLEQGVQTLTEEGRKKEPAHRTHEDLVLTTPGLQGAEDFDRTAADVTNFLVWASEPDQNQRKQIGVGVMLFLALLSFVAFKLSKNYWKDIR